jgi:hypothetical protein
MKHFVLSLICLASLIFFLQDCNLFDSATKKEVLPSLTQEGKNTLGCVVNGKVWLPKGNDGTSNLSLSYDPNYAFGTLNLFTYRITDNVDQSLGFYSDSLKTTGSYLLDNPERQAASFTDLKISCSYDKDLDVYHSGELIITRFDLQNQIISGTFEFTVARPGCDTIKVTQGRFDIKF